MCELKELGCEEVVQRKDANKHMEQATQKHLRLSTSYFIVNQKSQNEKVIMQGEAIAKLQEENEKLHIELKQSFEKQQRELSAVANKHEAIVRLRQECEELKKDLDCKSKKLSALSSQIDILTRHVSVSVTTVNYKKKRGTDTRWTNSEQFQTAPKGYTLKVNLYFHCGGFFDFELTPVNARSNVNLQWPKTFTMTVTMLNHTGNHSHHHITKDLEVRREGFNDDIQIVYNTIDDPPPGVSYIDNDRVKFQIFVTEKY